MTSDHKETPHRRAPFLTQRMNMIKGETVYVCIMCLVANCLSSIALDVGTRTPLGKTGGGPFASYFHRSYNLKVTMTATSIVSGVISTALVAVGDKYGVPYLYIPWLVNTIRGMALCEGPALLGLAYMLLPGADLPAGSFLFITLVLYVEELCLWNDVFSNFRVSWLEYNHRKYRSVAETRKNLKSKNREKTQHGDYNFIVNAVKPCRATTKYSDYSGTMRTFGSSSPMSISETPKNLGDAGDMLIDSDGSRCQSVTG